jgi:hypothetical protein
MATPRAETSHPWARPLFWALLGLIVLGIVAIFVSIPNMELDSDGGAAAFPQSENRP